VVRVTSCSQINCPQLTELASRCTANDSDCVNEDVSDSLTNYCHDNGVSKQSVRVYSGDNGVDYTTTMRVLDDEGDACYTLVMRGTSGGVLERWVFHSPDGDEVARGEWNKDDDLLTLICGNVRYVMDNIACPGTDGEPESGQCEEGECFVPDPD
jgi:hypothetical protein